MLQLKITICNIKIRLRHLEGKPLFIPIVISHVNPANRKKANPGTRTPKTSSLSITLESIFYLAIQEQTQSPQGCSKYINPLEAKI